jgi:hypothetical protein
VVRGAAVRDHKEETLFELEMLLKSFACFGNPRNHAGPPRKTPAVAHDFRDELRIVRDALQEAIAQTRQLLGPKDRAYVFSCCGTGSRTSSR